MSLRTKAFRKRTPGDLAEMQWDERGDEWINIAYTQLPINIHPNDLYIRVFPDGPYSQAWQGVQKNDPITQLGTNHMGIPNPYYRDRMGLPTVQYDNPAAWSVGAGPALLDAQDQDWVASQQQNPGLLQTVLAKLRGQ